MASKGQQESAAERPRKRGNSGTALEHHLQVCFRNVDLVGPVFIMGQEHVSGLVVLGVNVELAQRRSYDDLTNARTCVPLSSFLQLLNMPVLCCNIYQNIYISQCFFLSFATSDFCV